MLTFSDDLFQIETFNIIMKVIPENIIKYGKELNKMFNTDIFPKIQEFMTIISEKSSFCIEPYEYICKICESPNYYIISKDGNNPGMNIQCGRCNNSHHVRGVLNTKLLWTVQAVDLGPG